ncbi:hypothetical protein ABS71_02390 [bacterium SCN 62-11]|nr:S8 family serine peptidase [Candidatus Eremiobacteraeota bacterium]ODT77741.1 MAG: hypothetical protein ABS71_02390 [bacterium SCN 62-11]
MLDTTRMTALSKPICRASCLPNLSSTPDIHLADAQKRQKDALAAHNQTAQQTWEKGPEGLLLEAHKPEATLAVIDTFGVSSEQNVHHGEITAALALQASGRNESNLLRVDNGGVKFPTRKSDRLDEYIENRYTGFTHATTLALQEVHQKHPKINTISLSQGISGPRLTADLARRALKDPDYALKLAKDLGHPGPVDWNQPASQKLIAERVQSTLEKSPKVASELTALRQELADHPKVAFFSSAGNDGETQALLRQADFRFDPAWDGTPQSTSPLTQSVAAANLQGLGATPTLYSQHTPNSIAFDGKAKVTVDGRPLCEVSTDRPAPFLPWCAPHQGTSFSTPRAAGLYNADPVAYEKLRLQALPSVEGENTLGVGLLH